MKKNSIENQLKNLRGSNDVYLHQRKKNHMRFKRSKDAKFKRKEVVKNCKYQKKCDKIIKSWKKKGEGKLVKIKGQTLCKFVDTNSRCTKSWKYIGYGKDKPLSEGFKHSAIFYLT